MIRTIINWGWSPVLITALAIVGCLFEWPIELVAPILAVILVIGLVVAAVGARDKQLELASLKLRQQTGYFIRRFMGNSSLSIFAIIDSLFKIDDPKLWEWARACDMAQRVFDSWGNSFISRMESDTKVRSFSLYLRTYLNELWLVNNHYYEFVQQFYEIGEKLDIPQETKDQYNRFVDEYNVFVQNFRDNIAELKKVARTEVEPPGVMLARKLFVASPFEASQNE